jgi:hypothetical protein
MRKSIYGVPIALCLAGVVAQSSTSHAATLVGPPPPTGAGVEKGEGGMKEGVAPGWEASGALGTGFSDTYGLGIAGRVGYTLPVGVYLGGQVQAYWGQSTGGQTGHATFVGADVGYKLFPFEALEVRPYVFGGPAFISQSIDSAPFVKSKTGFAVQPGALTVVHMGPAFVGADFHFLATPSPFGVALLGSAGAGF